MSGIEPGALGWRGPITQEILLRIISGQFIPFSDSHYWNVFSRQGWLTKISAIIARRTTAATEAFTDRKFIAHTQFYVTNPLSSSFSVFSCSCVKLWSREFCIERKFPKKSVSQSVSRQSYAASLASRLASLFNQMLSFVYKTWTFSLGQWTQTRALEKKNPCLSLELQGTHSWLLWLFCQKFWHGLKKQKCNNNKKALHAGF